MLEVVVNREMGRVQRTQGLLRRLATSDRTHARVVVLVAHPGDESLGAAGLLSRLSDPWVVCLTDGAPRDRRFVPKGLPVKPTAYAKRRREEMGRALNLAGVGIERLLLLDIPDQEVALALPRLVQRLATLVCGLRPHLVVTHAYEGGHPDRDAAALAARLAVDRLDEQEGAAPALAEMLSYHREADRLVADRFLPASTDRFMVLLRLTPRERRLRLQMLECHASQVATMAQLPECGCERLRPAPEYDFLRPPHPGPLHYETQGFALDGARWRELAGQAIVAETQEAAARSAH